MFRRARRRRAVRLQPLALAFALALAVPALARQPAERPKPGGPGDPFVKSLQIASQALDLYGRYEDEEELERLTEIGYRVAQESAFREVPLTFHLIDMPAPNAFALPGGHIFVTRGMLSMGLSDDMLANLLGHEIAHVTLRHGLRMQRRAALMQALTGALMVGVAIAADNRRDDDSDRLRAPYDPRVRRDDGSTMVEGAIATSLLVSELLLRSYSRDFEREADEEGQRLAAAAGFDTNGLRDLMALMETRLPRSKKYGYWQTHPFFDERVRAGDVRADLFRRQEPSSADAYRRETQQALLAYREVKGVEEEALELLDDDALAAWPRGAQADEIRLADLHDLVEEEKEKNELAADYGRLIEAYRAELAEIARLDPKSPLLATLRDELGDLTREVAERYPKAVEVLEGGVYETPFLETFLSNFPDAPEVPKVALALGDAYSRLGRPADAVEQYLTAWRKAPESPQGQRAQIGLKTLAAVLDDLTALGRLAGQEDDEELGRLAQQRLASVVGTYGKLENGAEYLRTFPDGRHARAVENRLDALAENLYTEVVLYQGVGDNVKALDRIFQILTHAPDSTAAEKLRERAVVEG